MPDLTTTISLVVLTLLSLVATVASVLGLIYGMRRSAARAERAARIRRLVLGVCAVGSALVFAYRAFFVHQSWQPLQAHVDGLLLIAALLAATIMFLQSPSRMPGIGVFALPLLTLILAWAICASRFTLKLFEQIHSVWQVLHLASVYLGAACLGVAAIAGGMYLYAQRRLHSKQNLATPQPLASLETTEIVIIRTSALGFALLTLGLITGLIIVTSQPDNKLGPGWWHSPKVVLATVVWLIYALVMNVRHASTFRGARAAWLSIAGIVLLLATFGVVEHLDSPTPIVAPAAPVAAPDAPRANHVTPDSETP